MSRSTDPTVVAIAKTILDFNWANYGLDEVGEIREKYADYAWDLAREIAEALAEAKP